MSLVDITALSIIEVVGDFAFKEFANNGGITNFAIGCTGYVGVVYFLIRSLQGSTVLLVNSAWDGISALIESIAAMIVLGERFDRPEQYVGVVCIILGLLLLKIPWKRTKPFQFPKLISST